jgi:hydroxymethylglutaryl-CoA synthase
MSEQTLALGIESLGAYVPRYRLTAETVTDAWGQFHGAGISATAVPGADEDTLTMGYEAARRAMAAASTPTDDIDTVLLGTTTPPAEEEGMAPRLVSMLGLDDGTRTRQLTGTTRAGVDALVAGASREQRDGVLVVATDAPRGAPDDEHEHAGGAGAVGAVLSRTDNCTIHGSAEYVEAYPGTRFRQAGSTETTGLGVTAYDRTAFKTAIETVADRAGTDPATADAVALQAPNGSLPYRASGPLGVDADAIQRAATVHDIGDTGAASSLLGLVSALDSTAERVLVVGYGSGVGATAVTVDNHGVSHDAASLHRDTVTLSYGEYLRMRGDITPGEPDGGGAYVSVPSWKRTLPQRHRLVAGRCPECGTLAFPPEGACTDCRELVEYEHVQLPGTGTVEAVTAIGQGGAPPEFVEQQARSGPYASAVVALDGPESGTVSIPAQVVDVEADAVDIGDRVDATIRQVYTQEGVTRYGFKMVPATDA